MFKFVIVTLGNNRNVIATGDSVKSAIGEYHKFMAAGYVSNIRWFESPVNPEEMGRYRWDHIVDWCDVGEIGRAHV